MADGERRRPKLKGLRVSSPYRSFSAPGGFPLRAVTNKRGTTLFLIAACSPFNSSQLDQSVNWAVEELVSFWNANHREDP